MLKNTERMKFLEKDLEQIIFETPVDVLHKRGLFLGKKTKRQVRLGNYGIADLISVDYSSHDESVWGDNKIIFTVCELKQDTISVSAFLQAIRYAKGLQRYLKEKKPSIWFRHQIRIVLIGKTMPNDSSLIYLPDFMDMIHSLYCSLEIYTYDMDIDGLKFKKHDGYKLLNEGF